MKGRVLLGRERIHVATHGVDPFGDLTSVERFCAFEGKML